MAASSRAGKKPAMPVREVLPPVVAKISNTVADKKRKHDDVTPNSSADEFSIPSKTIKKATTNRVDGRPSLVHNDFLNVQSDEREDYSESEQSNGTELKNKTDELEQGKSREEALLDDCLDSSLISSTYTGKMIDLGETGYSCVEAIYCSATSNGEKKETVMARRLLDGVIKPEVIAVSTLSGRAARAQGPERQKKKVKILHPGAVAAIIDFSHSWALKYKANGWTTQTQEQIKQSLRARIVEIKVKAEEIVMV